jgi:flagellar hook-length control protein FliK
MQNISIKDLVKSTASVEPKGKNNKQDNNKTFSALLKNTAKTQTNAGRKAEDTKEPSTENVEKAPDKEPKNETVEKLVQLLMNSESSTKGSLDMDELKNLISQLLEGNLLAKADNSSSDKKTELMGFNLSNLQGVSSLEINSKEQLKPEIDMLVEQITNKLVTDSSFKQELIANLKSISAKPLSGSESDFKQAILEKLADMLRNGDKVEAKEASNQLLDNQSGLLSGYNTEVLSDDIINSRLQQESTSLNKEDKLLKSLTDENSSNDNKDNLTSKISNVMARFEAIRNDKSISQEAPVVINKSTFNADFIKAVKFMDLNNIKELSVKIIPKDLGEITIRLSMDNGVMKANITAANKDTYSLLNAQLPAISNQLSEQNMNIQSFNLSLYNGENFLFNGDGRNEGDNRRQGRSGNTVLAVDDEEAVSEGYAQESNLDILA